MYIPTKYLPTFNSSTKRTHVQFIPGLEDRFILADDDMFPVNEIGIYEYFNEDGSPRPFYDKSNIEEFSIDEIKNANPWRSIVINSSMAAARICGVQCRDGYINKFPYKHIPMPLLKSDLLHGYEIIKDDLDKRLTRTRNG